jgi:predicted AlkP superfamily pyrophosphatase or phosphodiesterase
MSKTIFVLLDGLGFDAATQNLGFAEHLIESQKGAKYKVQGELPSLSRPMYETLLTGRKVCEHGITGNLSVRCSEMKSVFDQCRLQGKTTGAAAYYWISELYLSAPFCYESDRFVFDNEGAINSGIFYFDDSYPDSHVFADAEYIRTRYDPDFLMVHSMNIDDTGHHFGSDSAEYQMAAARINGILSTCLPVWLALGYSVIVTSDHGMNQYKLHGGNSPQQRSVPLYIFAQGIVCGDFTEKEPVSQIYIAPLLCRLLEVGSADGMRPLSQLGVNLFQ